MEVKLIAPYLPYELNVFYDSKVWIVTSWDAIKCVYGLYREDEYIEIDEDEIRPILRPMSDLDKYGLNGDDYRSFLGLLNTKLPSEYNIDMDLDYEIENTPYSNRQYVPVMPFLIVFDFLFEHHFDVFGLIEQGLAIDINTI